MAACVLLLAVCAPSSSAAPQPECEPAEPQSTAGSALILAMGEGGTIGYVRSADLEGPEVRTPEEALAYQRQGPSRREIPLYAEDGVTVIGTFEIFCGGELHPWTPGMDWTEIAREEAEKMIIDGLEQQRAAKLAAEG